MDPAPQEIRTFFVTANTAGRRRLFQVFSNADLFLIVLRDDRGRGRYEIHAFVVMPDHIHLLLTPGPDVSLERAMQFIKGGFSFRLRSKTKVWQESFAWERMKDARGYAAHRDYIHANPVRQHLCVAAEDFAYSSARGEGIDPAPAHLRA
jgi:putative transposase